MKVIVLRSNAVNPDPRVEKEAQALRSSGLDVEILAWDRDEKYSSRKEMLCIEGSKIPIHRFGIKGKFGGGLKANFVPIVKFQFRMFFWLSWNFRRYQCIHACDFDTALTGFICSKIYQKKCIYDIFDYYTDAFNVPRLLKGLVKKIDDFIISNVDAVIICSERRKRQIKNSNPKRLIVVHNSPHVILPDSYNTSHCNENRKTKFVYVGILQPGRFIIEMIDIIKNRNDCELHIAGFGLLEDAVMQANLSYENIEFHGKLSYNEAISLENKCDIMMALYDPNITNHAYAAPNKFYEGLMLGKSLIMVKNTGMDSIVEENGFGEVIDYDIISLENAVTRLIHNRENRKEISDKMKKFYSDNFSWVKMRTILLQMYNDLKS